MQLGEERWPEDRAWPELGRGGALVEREQEEATAAPCTRACADGEDGDQGRRARGCDGGGGRRKGEIGRAHV